MPSLGGGGKYGGDDHNGRGSNSTQRGSNTGKHDDYDYYDDDSYRDTGGHRDALPPPGNNRNNKSENPGERDRTSPARQNDRSRSTQTRRQQQPTTNYRQQNRRLTAQNGFLDESSSSLTDNSPADYDYYNNDTYRNTGSVQDYHDPQVNAKNQAQGGHFGGWDSRGGASPTFENNQSYFKEKYRDSLSPVVDTAEKAKDQARAAGMPLDMAGGLLKLPSVNLEPLPVSIGATDVARGLIGKFNQQKVNDLVNRPGTTTEEKKYLESVAEDIKNAEPSLLERGLAMAGTIGATLTAGPLAGYAVNMLTDNILGEKATRAAADKYRTPEELAERKQQRIAKAEQRKKDASSVYDDKDYDQTTINTGGLLAANDQTPTAAPVSSGIAMPTYDFNYNSHLQNFARG